MLADRMFNSLDHLNVLLQFCFIWALHDYSFAFSHKLGKRSHKNDRRKYVKAMNFVLRVIGIFIAVAVAVWLVPGIEVGGTVSTWASVLIIALIIALLNMTIKPILQLFGLPITVITLGIFYIIINTALLYLASWLANGLFGIDFIIATFGSGFVASIVISIVSSIMNGLLGADSYR